MSVGRRRISRRAFLAGAATLAGAVAVAKVPFGVREALAGARLAARYPLYIPPVVSPTGYTLTAEPATVNVGGRTSSVWAYNVSLPGPTFRARRGDGAQITLRNKLSQETITHWHGMIVDHPNDGHPQQAIAPGGTYAYSFTIDQRAAFNWYHPHPHMLTGEQVAKGLAGGFIVTDDEEQALGLPSGDREVPLSKHRIGALREMLGW